jgi:hypothetical protein
MRYFEQYQGPNTHGGNYDGGSTYIGHLFYKVRKRTQPTLTGLAGNYSNLYNTSTGSLGNEDIMYFVSGTSGYITKITIDAEL